jgi:hypothetical protein
MNKEQRWMEGEITDGIHYVELASWRHFHDYVIEEMLDYSHYVWRGQRDASWPLKSSLDRLLDKLPSSDRVRSRKSHLKAFQKATRGRRGANPPDLLDDNEWWALGQHNGLATPLLDWSESPFVGLYFAFEKDEMPSSGKRSVWAIANPVDENRNALADIEWQNEPKTLSFVRPNQNENPRLLSQAGLFTRGPDGRTVDEWTRRYAAGNSSEMTLIKISIPEDGRRECLRTLNRMNINHATLFPDIYGAGAHCNRSLELGE